MKKTKAEDKDLMEAIQLLLQTTEELKAHIPSLEGTQKEIFDLTQLHQDAISDLMEKLLGTKKEHEKRLDELESTRSCGIKLEENYESHEKRMLLMEDRIKKLESAEVKRLWSKIEKEETIPSHDLETINSLLENEPKNESLLVLKALILEKMKKKKELLNFLEKATKICPVNAQLWYLKGNELKDFGKSLFCYNKSIELLGEKKTPTHYIWFGSVKLLCFSMRKDMTRR